MKIEWNVCGKKDLEKDMVKVQKLKNYMIDNFDDNQDGDMVMKQLSTIRDMEYLIDQLIIELGKKETSNIST